MSWLFEQIKTLYDQELYSNIVSLASLVITFSDHNPECLTPQAKFDTYVFYANSLFHLNKFRKAESIYRKALQLKKFYLKVKGATKPVENQKETMYDVDIKYNMHVCYLHMKDTQQAVLILDSINAKQRTPKVNMALAKLYHQSGNERSAISAYKEVLKECPLALEAAEGLLSLCELGTEVNSMILNATHSIGNMDWLLMWIRAHAIINDQRDRDAAKAYKSAVQTFKSLDHPTLLNNNVTLLTIIGECLYRAGDFTNALNYLQRARNLEPNMQRGLDILASLLAKEGRHKEIEKLITTSMNPSEYSSENWVVLAYHMHASKKWSKAAYFAQKACFLNPRNTEALVLKGTILLDLKKYQDAINHFREAKQITKSYDAHKGLVDCYVATHRLREALSVALDACKLEKSARAYTLYASVLVKDQIQVCRAKNYLKKALEKDETYLPAVYLLAEIYEQEMATESAIALLEKQLTLQTTWKLHQMLGDLLARTNNVEKALEHYSITLNLDPNNMRAIEGIQRIDHASSSSSNIDSAYCMSPSSAGAVRGSDGTSVTNESSVTDDTAGDADTTYEVGGGITSSLAPQPSVQDRDADDSETEAMWSDMDLDVVGN